jgi:hypothetical protein
MRGIGDMVPPMDGSMVWQYNPSPRAGRNCPSYPWGGDPHDHSRLAARKLGLNRKF